MIHTRETSRLKKSRIIEEAIIIDNMADDERQEPKPPTGVAVASACGRALGAWLLVYLVWMHLLVVWEWSSGDPVTVATPLVSLVDTNASASSLSLNATLEIEKEEDEYTTAFIAEKETEIAHMESDLKSLEVMIVKLQAETKKLNAAVLTTMAQRMTLKAVKERVERMVKKGMLTVIESAESGEGFAFTTAPVLDGLVKFYGRIKEAEVTDIPSDVFNKWIQDAIEALEAQIAEKDTVLWQNVSAIFSRKDLDFGAIIRKVADAISKQECPLEGSGVSLVNEDVLNAKVKVVQDLLKQRRTLDVPIVLVESLDRLQKLVGLRVEEVTKMLASETSASAQTASKDFLDCVLTQSVVPWVEAGLDALERKKDIRSALLHRLAMEAIDTSHIILDADLDDSFSTVNAAKLRQKLTRPQQTVSLRRLLAMPITTQFAPTIVDGVLDLVSGYNDALDQVLDSIIVAHQTALAATGDESVDVDRSSIGKELVHRLLEVAGKVQLPVPAAVRQSKLGMLILDQ